jgi:hypothetical protein
MINDVSTLLWIVAGLLAFWIVLKILKKILIAVLIGLLIVAAGILLRGTLW